MQSAIVSEAAYLTYMEGLLQRIPRCHHTEVYRLARLIIGRVPRPGTGPLPVLPKASFDRAAAGD